MVERFSGLQLEHPVRASSDDLMSDSSSELTPVSPARLPNGGAIPSLRDAQQKVTLTAPWQPSLQPVVSAADSGSLARPTPPPPPPPRGRVREDLAMRPPVLVDGVDDIAARPSPWRGRTLLWACGAVTLLGLVSWRQTHSDPEKAQPQPSAAVASVTPQPMAAETSRAAASDDLDPNTASAADEADAAKPPALESKHADRKKQRREAARARRLAAVQARHQSTTAKREAARARHEKAKLRREAAAEARREAAAARREAALTRREEARSRREEARTRRAAAAQARRERATGAVASEPQTSPTWAANMPTAATAKTSKSSGTLRVNSRPWAQVFIDGKLVGNTPQLGIVMPPGEHSVRLNNPTFAMSKSIQVDVRAGKTVTLVEQLDQ